MLFPKEVEMDISGDTIGQDFVTCVIFVIRTLSAFLRWDTPHHDATLQENYVFMVQ